MRAVRLTTAFAVVLGVVLPVPVDRDRIPQSWAAEKDETRGNGDLRQRAEDLAKSASDKFGEIVGGKEQPKAVPSADTARPESSTVGLAERVHSWTAQSATDYQELMLRLSRGPQLNPVADAAARVAAGRSQRETRPETHSLIETVIDWVHRAGLEYQILVRGLVSEPSRTVAAEKSPVVAGQQAEDERRTEEAWRAAEAQKAAGTEKADEARIAAAKQAEDTRRADEARRVAAAKQAEGAQRAEEAQKAADAKKTSEARIAAAKQIEDAQRAEEARRVAEAQKTADAKKADEARIAVAKQAEDARRAEEARRAAEAQKAAEAKREEERSVAAADRKPAQTKAPETPQARAAPSRKRAAKKGRSSRKLAVAANRKRARKTASATTGKGRRKKAAEFSCRMAGNRTNVPGWYIVRRGDTLWKIAARHYGKGRRNPAIYRANTRRIADPHRLVRCQRIYLPKFRRRG